MSKFIEVISHEYQNDQRWAINTESIMYEVEVIDRRHYCS